MPASVAQLDVHLTGDQDVIGSIPTGSGNIVENYHEMFSTVIHSLLLIQEEQLSVSGNRMCTSTGQPLRDCPVKMWLGKMTSSA